MDETKQKKIVMVDWHKLVMTFIFIAVTAVIFLSIGYVAGKNSAETSEVSIQKATTTEGTVATGQNTSAGTVSATQTQAAATSTATVNSTEVARTFCQKNATDGNEIKSVNYQEADGSSFVDCAIGSTVAGYHLIGKVINGVWTNIWQGNGDMSCELVKKYNIPTSINKLGCV